MALLHCEFGACIPIPKGYNINSKWAGVCNTLGVLAFLGRFLYPIHLHYTYITP